MFWLWNNFDLVWGLTLDHARLSVIPIIVGFMACVPLGWLANRHAWLRTVLISVGGILFTIPSLALFVALPAIIGTRILDDANVVVALSIYSIAIMVRTATEAFASVPPDVTDSAIAVGFAPFSRFASVELPLAGPVLLAGLRVVSVTTVSLVSVGALIGVANLGFLFTNGYYRDFPEEILIGIVFTMLVALLFDLILVQLGRILMPWNSRDDGRRARSLLRLSARTVS